MAYSIRCNGVVLGATELDFPQLHRVQHSGWLLPSADADQLLDAVSIGYASVRAWMVRGETFPNGEPLTSPAFAASPECQAISASVAERLRFVLTLHRADGSELPTREIVVQDHHCWPAPWDEAKVMPDEGDDADADPYEGLDDAQRAELEAAVEHDLAVLREMWAEERPRYQVHVRLAEPDDLPSSIDWLADGAE